VSRPSRSSLSSAPKMTSAELERLVGIGQLKREAPVEGEVEGLVRSGETRLADARQAMSRC
jgi:hypothetical protein